MLGGNSSSSSIGSSGSGDSSPYPFVPGLKAAGPSVGPPPPPPGAGSAGAAVTRAGTGTAATAAGENLKPPPRSYSHSFPPHSSSGCGCFTSSCVTTDDTPCGALGDLAGVKMMPVATSVRERRHLISSLAPSSSPPLSLSSAPGVLVCDPRRSLSLGSRYNSSSGGGGGGGGRDFVTGQRQGRPRGGRRMGASEGVWSSGRRGYRRRGLASASNPPEQYLRYIHRVKTDTPEEEAPAEVREL